MEDPTAKMAMGFAGQGISVGQQYMEQNVCWNRATTTDYPASLPSIVS